ARTVFQCHRDVNGFLPTLDLQRHYFARLVFVDLLDEPVVALDVVLVEMLDHVTRLESRLGGGAVFSNPGQLSRALAVLALDAEKYLRRRRAHADLFAVDDGVNGTRILTVVIDAHPAERDRRQSFGDLVPGLAAIGGLVDAAAGSPLFDRVVAVVALGGRHPGAGMTVEPVALPFPRGNQQRFGISGVHLHVDNAGLVVDRQDLGPRLPAVGRFVKTTLLVRSPEPAQRAHVDNLGLLRM